MEKIIVGMVIVIILINFGPSLWCWIRSSSSLHWLWVIPAIAALIALVVWSGTIASWWRNFDWFGFPTFFAILAGLLVWSLVYALMKKIGAGRGFTLASVALLIFYFVLIPFGKMVEQKSVEAEKVRIANTITKPLVNGLWTKLDNTKLGDRQYDFDVVSVIYYVTNGEEEPPLVSELPKALLNPVEKQKLIPIKQSETKTAELPGAIYYYVTPTDAGKNGTLFIRPPKG